MKVALLHGVQIHFNESFEEILEPEGTDEANTGWRVRLTSKNPVLSKRSFDVIIGANGAKSTLPGFKRNSPSNKPMAIGITANFVNSNQIEDKNSQERSGVNLIFDQPFFKNLRENKIDLENVVYYKDETHYFVMTPKKQSLINYGVFVQVRKRFKHLRKRYCVFTIQFP